MTYLLDTNVWLFGANAPDALPEDVRSILGKRDAQFGLSAISLWEVGKKHQLGRLELKHDLGSWLRGALAAHIHVLEITPEIVADAMSLPAFPNRDPADELVVATSRVHQLTLLTTDTKLKGYRHARIQYITPIQETGKK